MSVASGRARARCIVQIANDDQSILRPPPASDGR